MAVYVDAGNILQISRPVASHNLQTSNLIRGKTNKITNNADADVEYRLSYAISYEDLLYLQHHKIYGQDSPFNPEILHELSSKYKNEIYEDRLY